MKEVEDPLTEIKHEEVNVKTVQSNGEENKEGLLTIVPEDCCNSEIVMKQEESHWINCCDNSHTILPDILHSQECTKTEGSTSVLNNMSQAEDTWITPVPTLDNMYPETITSSPCEVKTEPLSDDEQDCDEQKTIVGYPLDVPIKTEMDADGHYLIGNEVKQIKASEAGSSGAEMKKHESALCDDDIVKSMNHELLQNIIDSTESYNNAESMSDSTDKQQNCRTVDKKTYIFQEDIQKLCCRSEAGFTCSMCGTVFNSNQTCLQHIQNTHTSEKPNACEHCGKTFKRKQYLVRHKAIHTGEKRHTCDVCAKAFNNPTVLWRHKKTCHSNERPYSCDICGKTFKVSEYLIKHKACHSEQRSHPCNICGKAFKQLSTLYHHKAACHSSERPHVCDVCGKAFKVRDVLIQHMACHSDARPYSCAVCGKAFKRSIELCKHRSSCHSDERPYSCDVCGEAFRVRSELNQHKAAYHTNETLHSCDICGKLFKQRYDLLRHRQIHTGEKPHICEICGRAFKRRYQVLSHIQQVHGKDQVILTPDVE